jgi:hypothetical protein
MLQRSALLQFSRWLVITVLLFVAPSLALAHGMRSAYLEIDETSSGSAIVRVRTTVEAPSFTFDIDGCVVEPEGRAVISDSGRVRSFRAQCEGGLAGRSVRLHGLGRELEEATLWFRDLAGNESSAVVLPQQPSLALPAPRSPVQTGFDYVALGLAHIAGGLDHLLFLALLVLHVRKLRLVLLAETAFSLSHGLAFAATSLGWIRLNPAPTEACIALSIVLIALDVGRRAAHAREVVPIALTFGLVHGLGFAGGLTEVGLPEKNIAPALLGFGLGVEFGQLLMVLAMLGLVHGLRKSQAQLWLQRGVVLASGGLAMFWLFSRTISMFIEEAR